jgi:hypothetical protein
MGQRRRSNDPNAGPLTICQTLVTSDGTIRIEAALAGSMTRLRRPIATVGRPRPVTPFTRPPAQKAITTMRRSAVTLGIDVE